MVICEWRKDMKNKGKIIFFTKEDGIMYEVLKNMRNKSAMDLLKENGISLTPPINISLLLQRLGIKESDNSFHSHCFNFLISFRKQRKRLFF